MSPLRDFVGSVSVYLYVCLSACLPAFYVVGCASTLTLQNLRRRRLVASATQGTASRVTIPEPAARASRLAGLAASVAAISLSTTKTTPAVVIKHSLILQIIS